MMMSIPVASVFLLLYSLQITAFSKIHPCCRTAKNIAVVYPSPHIVTASKSLGGIYEFSGPSPRNQPPPELAELLGNKVRKKKPKKSAKKGSYEGARKNGRKGQESKELMSVPLAVLERQVLSKYGSNAYKNIEEGEDYDDDDIYDDSVARKSKNRKAARFQGFQQFIKTDDRSVSSDAAGVSSVGIEEVKTNNDFDQAPKKIISVLNRLKMKRVGSVDSEAGSYREIYDGNQSDGAVRVGGVPRYGSGMSSEGAQPRVDTSLPSSSSFGSKSSTPPSPPSPRAGDRKWVNAVGDGWDLDGFFDSAANKKARKVQGSHGTTSGVESSQQGAYAPQREKQVRSSTRTTDLKGLNVNSKGSMGRIVGGASFPAGERRAAAGNADRARSGSGRDSDVRDNYFEDYREDDSEQKEEKSWRYERTGTGTARTQTWTQTRAGTVIGVEDVEEEEEEAVGGNRFGPLNAVEGYRLRRPPPIDPQQLAATAAREAALEARRSMQEEARQARLKARRLESKDGFVPFDFTEQHSDIEKSTSRGGTDSSSSSSRNGRSSDSRNGEEEGGDGGSGGLSALAGAAAAAARTALFETGRSFEELGVTDPVVLHNLQRLQVFQPTSIQAAAISAMHAVDPTTAATAAADAVLVGADTGSTTVHAAVGGAPTSGGSEGHISAAAGAASVAGVAGDVGVVLQAQTGSGKTLAYLLSLRNFIDPASKKVQAIVFAPSRELVTQIGGIASKLYEGTDVRVVTIIGGANVKNQIKHLREDRPQVVVATPGRLAELVFGLEKVRLGMLRAVVIDEVDNMLQEPYVGEIETILQAAPLFSKYRTSSLDSYESDNSINTSSTSRAYESSTMSRSLESEEEEALDVLGAQSTSAAVVHPQDPPMGKGVKALKAALATDANPDAAPPRRLLCLASATSQDPAVTAFATRYCGDQWRKVSVQSASMLPASITHGLVSSPRMRALGLLRRFLHAQPAVQSALIFVNDPRRVELLVEQLYEMGFVAAPLHGDSSKDDRKEVIARLRDGRLKLVVTTELAARGLDIPDLTHVVNFELPTDAQHYVHRTGRCGRAGKQGLVMNFANPETKFVIRRFGKKLGVKIHDCEIRNGRVYLKSK